MAIRSVEGSSLATAAAGITIDLQRANAVVLQILEGRSPTIEDQLGLGRVLARRFRDKEWAIEQFVVTEVYQAEAATILIASGSNARIEFSAARKLYCQPNQPLTALASFPTRRKSLIFDPT